MPYIKQSDREWLERAITFPNNSGELNFVITKLILRYIKIACRGTSYSAYNEVIGVLECVKQELYRRAVSVYEDEKLNENGDVFTEHLELINTPDG